MDVLHDELWIEIYKSLSTTDRFVFLSLCKKSSMYNPFIRVECKQEVKRLLMRQIDTLYPLCLTCSCRKFSILKDKKLVCNIGFGFDVSYPTLRLSYYDRSVLNDELFAKWELKLNVSVNHTQTCSVIWCRHYYELYDTINELIDLMPFGKFKWRFDTVRDKDILKSKEALLRFFVNVFHDDEYNLKATLYIDKSIKKQPSCTVDPSLFKDSPNDVTIVVSSDVEKHVSIVKKYGHWLL